MQERVRYEHQTPMFLNGFGAAHAVVGQAQVSFPILIKGFRRPPQQVGGDDLGRVPIQPIRDQDHVGPAQCHIREANHEPHLSQRRNAHRQAKAPVGGLANRDWSVGRCGNAGHQVFHRDMGLRQGDGHTRRVAQHEAVRFQLAVALQDADPILLAPGRGFDQFF